MIGRCLIEPMAGGTVGIKIRTGGGPDGRDEGRPFER
jgi:hypothetical protein